MEIPEKDYDEFEGRLKKLSYATDYIPSSDDLVCHGRRETAGQVCAVF